MTKWLPTIVSVTSAVLVALADPIQHGIAAHPTVAAVGAAILGIVSHFWPSPLQK